MEKNANEIIEEYSNIAPNLRAELQAVLEKYGVTVKYDVVNEINYVMYKGVRVDDFGNFDTDFLNWTPFNK